MSNALLAYRPVRLPSQAGTAAERLFRAANGNRYAQPRAEWSEFKRLGLSPNFGRAPEFGMPVAVSEGAARVLPFGAARLFWPLMAGILVQEGLDAWARWNYPGSSTDGIFTPAGARAVNDYGTHAASTAFHLNLLPLTGWASGSTILGTGLHGQALSNVLNPLHRYLYYLEADQLTPNPQRWYVRANFESLSYPSANPWIANGYPVHQAFSVPHAAPLPWYYPALDPFALPIKQPVPSPRPLPWHYPVRLPEGDPLGEPVPRPVPAPRPVPVPVPGPPGPVPGVVSIPALESVAGSGGGLRQTFHEVRPPRAREREGKRNPHGGALSMTWAVANAVTESLDFLNAFWWALPQEFRTPWASPLQKMLDLIDFFMGVNGEGYTPRRKNSHKLQWKEGHLHQWGTHAPTSGDLAEWFVKSFANVTRNEFTDSVIGHLAKGANQITKSQYWGTRPLGVTAGPVM